MSSLGVFDKECFTFLEMLDTIGMDKKQQHYCIKKMTSYAIRATSQNRYRAEGSLESEPLKFLCRHMLLPDLGRHVESNQLWSKTL